MRRTRHPLRILQSIMLASVLLALHACGPKPDREAAVRAVLEQAEQAAESRDVGAAMELVSEDYADAEGLDRRGLQQFVRGYFVLNPRIELLVRIESLEFPEGNRARLRLQIGSLGTRLEADRFTIELVDESGSWRLLRAERQSR
jgi:hypothetical protein